MYTFRHEELGELGSIVLQARTDGNTQANCELAGDPEEPLFQKRAAIFKPLALRLVDKMHDTTGTSLEVTLAVPAPKAIHGITSKLISCEKCRQGVAFLILADEARSLGELEDYARLMFPKIRELNLPAWVIGQPVGNDPPPERPADILKVWPERESVRRLRPDVFNPIIDALIASHCG